MRRIQDFTPAAFAIAVTALMLFADLPATAEEESSVYTVVFGVEGISVDSEEGRDGRFSRYQDNPDGFVLDYLRAADLFGEGAHSIDFTAYDALQDDERYRLRLGIGENLRLRYGFNSTPLVFGNKGRSLLGADLRVGDAIQRLLEDPDGNGVPFYLDPLGVTGDNQLVQGLTNDLLAGATPFDVGIKRQSHDLDVSYQLSPAWSVGVDFQHHESRGSQPLGSGTYQRITDVDGDGRTDYDYFFSIRGVELPAAVDYTTTNSAIWAGFRQDRWFGQVRYTYSEFDNDEPFVTYDNPFWFTPTVGSSGIQRGLWEEGRASQAPSNDAWNLALSGGVNLGDNTRLTASVTTGEHGQNERFAPITTNPATIGTADLNGDGVLDSRDDPTSLSILPRQSLDATSDITSYNVRLTSRPTERFRVNASWRAYEYDGGTSDLVIPGRTEYIESRIKTDFKGTRLAFVPHSYERENLKLEGVLSVTDDLRVVGFWKRDSYDWTRYLSLDDDDSREVGNRAVAGTDSDTLGLRLSWSGPEWVAARFEWSMSEREFNGPYQIGFSGENLDLRQFDIANRDRDTYEARLDFYPTARITFGVEGRASDDDYPDSLYGLLEGSNRGWTADANLVLSETANLYLYFGESEAETEMHLRTKCSNCVPPPGATWSGPWEVPNYDWFPSYEDGDLSIGGALSFHSDDARHRLEIEFDYVDAKIEQKNVNPGVPQDLGAPGSPAVQVALAVDFPDQTNTFTNLEAKYIRRLSDRVSVGARYLYEEWKLDDFQLQALDAYGGNFLAVDDATRFMFLDAWYGSMEAQVGQLFVRLDL